MKVAVLFLPNISMACEPWTLLSGTWIALSLRNLVASINSHRRRETSCREEEVGTLTPFHWEFMLLKCI